MARYTITTDDGETIYADDARNESGFVKYIEKDTHREIYLNKDKVRDIKTTGPGSEGGKRFDGSHDSSFGLSFGSIGGPSLLNIDVSKIDWNNLK